MTKDFKNAAAKLLAQHSTKKPEINAAKVEANNPVEVKEQKSVPSIDPLALHDPAPIFSPRAKIGTILGLAILGFAIMVFLVPETIWGIAFNAIFGIISGGALGYIIVKD